jgi:hypothetical protein
VPTSRIRVLVLGLLAVMLVGSVTAGAASANAGPFWYHRLNSGETPHKVSSNEPENFSGKGGVQTLIGEPAAGAVIEIKSPATQVKGAILNAEHQGQIKLVIFYQPLSVQINGVPKPNCIATVGQQNQFSNIVQLKGHLAWKWDGSKQQLEEQPQRQQKWDIIFTPYEPQRQEPGFPLIDTRKQGTFAEINLVGAECGVLAGKQKVAGTEVGIPFPSQLEEFSKELTVRTIASGQLPKEVLGEKIEKEGFLQHVWVGTPTGNKEFQPLILGLTFAGNPANLIGQTEIKTEQQEIGVRET